MSEPATDRWHALRVWRAALSGSRAVAAGLFLASVFGRRHRRPHAGPAGQRRDEALLGLLESNLVVRLMGWSGEVALRAWHDSMAAATLESWTVLALERRVRLSALALGVAVLVHLTLTGFRAPEPTTTARVVWIAVLVVIALAGIGARGIAAALTGQAMRRGIQGGDRQ